MNITKLLFILGVVICLPLYGFLCLTNLDPVTGFFSSSTLLTTLFYGALFLIPVLMLLFSQVIQKQLSFSISNSKILAVLSFLLGVAMIGSGVTHLLFLLSLLDGAMFGTILLTGLLVPLSLLSGLSFLWLGIGYLRENINRSGSMSFLLPVSWSLITCVELFRDYPQIAGMPERTLYLLCLLSFTLFLLGQSRILNNIDFARGVRWSNGFGFCAGLFGLTLTVGEAAAFSTMSLPLLDVGLTLAIALYCIAFSVNAFSESK